MKKKKGIIILICFLLLICTPIPIKTAIDDPIIDGNVAEIQSLDSFVGTQVSLLCKQSENETDPDDYEFVIIAIEQNGSFVEIPEISRGLYVYPKHFVGPGIKFYNYGYMNTFIFYGILEKATENNGKSYLNNYSIRLSDWDIVYPIYHHELYLLPNNDYFNSHLFFLDLLF